ncbi:AAA domain-containing protein [Actinacidiphila sp. bgisy160]|uniref:AAA domain-containing protein n=1 Tax=Actinacidiphila sp. bgisy160 TaxID=3413796 RepID=UPI003D746325
MEPFEQMHRLIERFLCGPTSALRNQNRSYRPSSGKAVADSGYELIPGALYRYDLVDLEGYPVTVQLYRGLSEVAGQLWEQEVRVLLRAAALRHPALPVIETGGYRDGGDTASAGIDVRGFAYVVTKGAVHSLPNEPGLLEGLRTNPSLAVRQFFFLADALSVLHRQKIVHRNLWPGTIDVHQDESMPPGPERLQLKLSRFEMSALVGNLLRAAESDGENTAEQAVRILLGQDSRALAYCAPERLAYLFPDADTQPADQTGSDVFSLGATVAEWFLPTDPGQPTPPSGTAGQALRAWALERHEKLRRALNDCGSLPVALKSLLADMLHPDPEARPNSEAVVNRISAEYEEISGYWDEEKGSQLPYLIAFLPAEFRRTLYTWGWLSLDPETPEGREELAQFIRDDLKGARLLHAEHGADPYVVDGPTETKRAARQLLIGARAAWFCERFRPYNVLGTSLGPPEDNTLVIKYPVPLDRPLGRTLQEDARRSPLHRIIPSVDVIPYDIHPAEFAGQRRNRPSWTVLIDAITRASDASPEDLVYEQAFDWLLKFQGIELRAREYAYEIDQEGSSGRLVTLRLDSERDDRRKHHDAMSTSYYSDPQLRPSLGDFFAAFNSSEEGGEIEVLRDRKGMPHYPRDRRLLVSLVDQLGDEAIRVRISSRDLRSLPSRGWIRPGGDLGSAVALRRQLHARWRLLENKVLVKQLQHPMTIKGLPGRWEKAAEGIGQEVVTDMLVSQPFYALQGPPGTGKTEMTARAVAAYLREEPGARVLVSAQSNWALDNLAVRILERLPVGEVGPDPLAKGDVIALRVTTRSTADRIDERLKRFRPSRLAEERVRLLQSHAVKRREGTEKRLRALLTEWERVAASSVPELTDRIRRSANLVFATCSSADPEHMSGIRNDEPFDWVLIEEAAKAWPTEIAIPLAQGLRWTLIGDHHQLPAHRRQEVERFLQSTAVHPDPNLALHGTRSKQYLRVFNLFGSLFDGQDQKQPARPDTEQTPADGTGQAPMSAPVRTLDEQFRMNREIGDLVSKVFYPAGPNMPRGTLRITTGKKDEPHGFASPEWLGGSSLLWLDTAALTMCADQPAWKNVGEVDVVDRFVSRLGISPVQATGSGHAPLAVLTPYRQQTELLRGRGQLAPFVHTVHAFQGREADTVVTSLVRDKIRGPVEQPWKSLGHLVQPDLVNVMCSRARRLLVLVGDHGHFANSGVPFWEDLCAIFSEHRAVRPAGHVFDR